MGELKLNITYEKDLNGQRVHIDTDIPYQEDYQMKMLKNNDIEDMIRVSGTGIDGGSRYTFRTDGWTSLEKKFETKDMDREEIQAVTAAVLTAAENLKNFMLNPDNMLIMPEMIFEKEGKYRFCYLPVGYRPLCEAFHDLTEFFVKRLDYRDTEGIFLAYRLHKETMQEHYELKMILDDCRKEEKERSEERKKEETRKREIRRKEEEASRSFMENIIFTADEEETVKSSEDDMYLRRETRERVIPLREEYARYGPLKKVMTRIRTGIWGEWEDMITETDGQDGMSHL